MRLRRVDDYGGLSAEWSHLHASAPRMSRTECCRAWGQPFRRRGMSWLFHPRPGWVL